MSTMGERIKAARETRGLLQSQLAKLIGVKSAGVISNWEKDVSKPDANKMVSLCKALDISLSYLLNYHANKKEYDNDLSKEALQIAKYYDELEPANQRVIKRVITAMAEEEKETKRTADNVRFIDLFDLPVSAGTGVYLDGYNAKPIKIVNTSEAAKADYALRVTGDSMEPQYYNGDIVLIKTTPDVPQGAVGVFIHNGEGFIKQRDNSHLCSFNPKYPPIEANESTITKGQVLGKAILA